MKIHVLPGDAQLETFKQTRIEGDIVVCRECLIEGPLAAAGTDDFWKARAAFLSVDLDEYSQKTVAEFEKLKDLAAGDEVNLWFEYELFCQVNMWFCLSLINNTPADVYRVAPAVRGESEIWKGFGRLTAEDLKKCYSRRVKFADPDIALGAGLWGAYRNGDHQRLRDLSGTNSDCFPYLKDVCDAELEKGTRPAQILKEITASGLTEFRDIFPVFVERAGVYGYGDSQVKRILSEV